MKIEKKKKKQGKVFSIDNTMGRRIEMETVFNSFVMFELFSYRKCLMRLHRVFFPSFFLSFYLFFLVRRPALLMLLLVIALALAIANAT